MYNQNSMDIFSLYLLSQKVNSMLLLNNLINQQTTPLLNITQNNIFNISIENLDRSLINSKISDNLNQHLSANAFCNITNPLFNLTLPQNTNPIGFGKNQEFNPENNINMKRTNNLEFSLDHQRNIFAPNLPNIQNYNFRCNNLKNQFTSTKNLITTNPLKEPASNQIPAKVTTKRRAVLKEKKFSCNFEGCGKKFEYKWILNRHKNSHFSFRLFKCETCTKSYKSKENLNLHIKNKHLNLKPYQCDYCDSKFSHRNGRNKTLL